MIKGIAVAAVLLITAAANGEEFSAEAIRGHMRFLASDLLEGRGTGTRGYELAAAYVSAQLEAAGIAPGAGTSYYQTIPFRKTMPSRDSELTLLPDNGRPIRFRFGEGFATTGDPLYPEKSLLAGRVVLVGYGVTAPELGHDDYAGVDVRQKIVAYFSGAPAKFANTVRAHYSSSLLKIENASAHGAAGVIVLNTRADAQRVPWDRRVRQNKLGSMHWLKEDGQPHAALADVSHTVTLSVGATEMLFANSGRTYDQIVSELESGTLRAAELPVRASIQLSSAHERVQSPNVVGVLQGSDPKLRNEYLVISSHLDHLGVSDPVNGDTINNGALDNASGIAALLEIARAFTSRPARPRRSIIFLATTAEEKGLRGADYFANNPTVPIRQVVGNINIDQILMLHAVRDVVPLGMEVSDLGVMARKVAAAMNLEISPEPYPDEVIFVRSDQYPFVKAGVPALYANLGYKPVDGKTDVLAANLTWFRTIYHSPQDDLGQNIDYSMGALLAKFNYLVAVEAANRTAPPAWTPGNYFGEKFGRRR
ncbi:MAG TPA: M20/M25/M40 family metallo-hydrolase [Thermoanaerobaculia bacterium]|nr:M20/M25/M40 family metallo-hydrolase [Thermoanaerobaculia bacterium]